MMRTLIITATLSLGAAGLAPQSCCAADNEFYAMDNGIRDVKSIADKAALLRELGYDGVTWRPGTTAEAVKQMTARGVKMHALMMNLADDDNIGVSLTLCHQLKLQGVQDLAPLLKKALPGLFIVQVSGAESGDTRSMGWDKLIQPLGQGSYDVNGLLQILEDLGYQGPIGVIGFGIRQPASQHLRQSIAFWRGTGE